MRTARFFVSPEWIALGDKAFSIPAGPMYKQIVVVLRMKVGDLLSLCPNDGTELECKITEITKSAILGLIISSKAGEVLRPSITICAAITKRDTFEWMLQKCTELGVTMFMPIISDRVIKRAKEVSGRWNEIVKEASEQSGRTSTPIIAEPVSLSIILHRIKDFDHKIVLHESLDKTSSMPKVREMDKVAIVIGPEGGFSDKEIAQCTEAGCIIVQLGNLVMRAETAAIVATALIKLG